MDIYSSVEESVIYLLDGLSDYRNNERKSSVNYIMRRATEGNKPHSSMSLGDINGKECTMMSSNMSNPVRNVNDELASGMKSLYIQRGALRYGRRWGLMSYTCHHRKDLDILCLQETI